MKKRLARLLELRLAREQRPKVNLGDRYFKELENPEVTTLTPQQEALNRLGLAAPFRFL